MSCGKMKWNKAMGIARREYPNRSLKARKRIAAGIVGGSKKKKK